MAIESHLNANVDISTDSFEGWINKTNELIYQMGTVVLTSGPHSQPNTTNGAWTTGNSHLEGILSANTFAVVSSLRGGTVSSPANLVISSNTVFEDSALISITSNTNIFEIDSNNTTISSNVSFDGGATKEVHFAVANTSIDSGTFYAHANAVFDSTRVDIYSTVLDITSNTMFEADSFTANVSSITLGGSGLDSLTVKSSATFEDDVIFSGDTSTFSNDVVLGSDNTDVLSINAEIDTDLIPTDSNSNFGSLTNVWGNAYITDLFAENIEATEDMTLRGSTTRTIRSQSTNTAYKTLAFELKTSSAATKTPLTLTSSGLIPGANGAFNLGSSDFIWKDLYANTAIITSQATLNGSLEVNGNTTFNANVSLQDNDVLSFGDAADLSIYSDGSNSHISGSGSGTLKIEASQLQLKNSGGTKTHASFEDGGSAILYYNGISKLSTKTDGVLVSGEVEASSLDINGVSNISGNTSLGGTLSVTGNASFSANVSIPDNKAINVGSGNDLTITHDGANSTIAHTGAGSLVIDSNDLDLSGNTSVTGTLSVGDVAVSSNVDFSDGAYANFGSGDDLKIYHDGTNSFIEDSGTGSLIVKTSKISFVDASNNEILMDATENGASRMFYNGVSKLTTKTDGVGVVGELEATSLDINGVADVSGNTAIGGKLTVTGTALFNANVSLQDNDVLSVGTSNDTSIYHDGSDSFIEHTGAGSLIIASDSVEIKNGSSTETLMTASADGAVSLRYNNVEKMSTKTDGVLVSGELEATSLDINGVGDISGNTSIGGNLAVTGTASFNANVSLQDSDVLKIGNSGDLTIHHDGFNSFIKDVGSGDLFISSNALRVRNAANTANMITAMQSGAVTLSFNGSDKIATKSDGISVTGEVEADTLTTTGDAVIGGDLFVTGNTSITSNASLSVNETTINELTILDKIVFSGSGGFGSDVDPIADNTYDLGSPSNYWSDIYVTNVHADNAYVTDITSTGTITANNISGSLDWSDVENTPSANVTIVAGNSLSGGGSFNINQANNSSLTIDHETSPKAAGVYGSTSNSTKIDTITIDAYGHITEITTGAAGSIEQINANDGLTGGGTSSTVNLAVDGTVLRTTGDQIITGSTKLKPAAAGETPLIVFNNIDEGDNVPAFIVASDGEATDVMASFRANSTATSTNTSPVSSTADDKVVMYANGNIVTVGSIDASEINANVAWTSVTGKPDATITIGAGAGLTTGGSFTTNQAANETINLNIGAGDGITVGADSVSVDSTVIRTSGDQSITGTLSATEFDGAIGWNNVAGAPDATITIGAGAGLTTGGSFTTNQTANETINLNIGAGDGITVSADAVAVDSTVVRTTGTQSIAGNKTFSGNIEVSGSLTHNGNTVWSADNDGAGSGLDADMLDGKQLSTIESEYQTYSDNAIAALANSAPGTLDTLNELAAALGDDPNFATTVTNQISTKADSNTVITAGSGLTGGGDLSSDRTISHADTSTAANTNTSGADIIDYVNVDGFGHVVGMGTRTISLSDLGYTGAIDADKYTSWTIQDHDGTSYNITSGDTLQIKEGAGIDVNFTADDQLTIAVLPGSIDHDSLSGYVANEHVDHSTVNISAGDGLSGGGDITSSRTLAVDSTVVRTSGVQTIGGNKNFGSDIKLLDNISLDFGDSIDASMESNGSELYLRMNLDQNFYIKDSNNSVTHTFNANTGDFTASGDVTAYSDARIKENVETVGNALDKVSNMRGVYYNRIGEVDKKLGVIAQEVEKIVPEVVTEHDNGIKSVAYGNMIGLLIEAIKELKDEVEELKNK